MKRSNKKALVVFLDFRKVFASVHQGKVLRILHAYCVPSLLVTAIGKLYEDKKAKIITPDGETELFEILAGILLGDTLLPYIFAIYLRSITQ